MLARSSLSLLLVCLISCIVSTAAQGTTGAAANSAASSSNTAASGSTGYAYTTYPYDYTGLPRNDTGPLCSTAAPADVVLNVPNLSVNRIALNVNNLNAKLALTARALSLVTLNAGVNVTINNVNLQINKVQAAARLEVRLDNMAAIVTRVLDAIDLNPVLGTVGAISGGLGSTAAGVAGATTNTVGGIVNGATGAVGGVKPHGFKRTV